MCVKVVSWSSPKLSTQESAKNKPLNSKALVPSAAPPAVSGTKAVPAETVVAPTIVPETSRFPFTSIVVAVICTSVSASMSNWPSAEELILSAESLKVNVGAPPPVSVSSNPSSCTCVS